MEHESIYKRYFLINEPDKENTKKSFWLVFNSNNDILINLKNKTLPFIEDLNDLNLKPIRQIYIGTFESYDTFVSEVTGECSDKDFVFLSLWDLANILDEDLYLLCGRAVQIVNWDKTHIYCGACGAKTENMINETAKICPECGFISYTRIAPAVITAILKDDEILLARHGNVEHNFYGLVAGFVEAGETLEDAVKRETMEEVGITVKNIKYFSSQAWPYPNSLMVGFIAEHESGEINVDGDEIHYAQWFSKDNLPNLPPNISIAYELIKWYIDNY